MFKDDTNDWLINTGSTNVYRSHYFMASVVEPDVDRLSFIASVRPIGFKSLALET